MFSICVFRGFHSSLTYHDICGPNWWLRGYSSQASAGCKLKAESLFLNCLELLFLCIAIFDISLEALMPGGPQSRGPRGRQSRREVNRDWRFTPTSRTEIKGLSEREGQRQNRIPVIAHT